MNGDGNRGMAARLTELEATVRGLTQELVSAEERIRQLEATLEDGEAQATKDTRAESQPDDETAPPDGTDERGADLDDIIVA